MQSFYNKGVGTARVLSLVASGIAYGFYGFQLDAAEKPSYPGSDNYRFDGTISREVLDNYLS